MIRSRKFSFPVIVIALFLFGLVGFANAQGIMLDPNILDFGDVEIGTLSTSDFRISPNQPVPLTVESISFVNGSNPAFDIEQIFVNNDDGPIFVDSIPESRLLYQQQDDYLDVFINFLPSSFGLHTASIRIESDAEPPDTVLDYLIRGTGVGPNPIPEPSTALLLGTGLAFLAGLGRKKFFQK